MQKNKLLVIDLNVFCHFIKDELEGRAEPLSAIYNIRAVKKAKEELRLVRAIKAAYKGDAAKQQLADKGLPATVKQAQGNLTAAKRLQSDEKSVIQACFVWLVSGQWLGPLRDEHSGIVFVGDLKAPFNREGSLTFPDDTGLQVRSGYWRHWYLMQPEVYRTIPDKEKNARRSVKTKKPLAYMDKPLHYKSGRAFPSDVLTRVRREVLKLIKAKGFPILSSYGDEADDHAALMIRINEQLPPDKQRHITLVTTDGDWTQLISPRVTWFCMYGHYPRIRANVDDLNAWKAITGANGSIAKIHRRYGADAFPEKLGKPEDIVLMKTLIGDTSDSLPPGSPVEVIDLRNPPARFDLMSRWEAVEAAKKALSTQGNLVNDEKLVEAARGFLRGMAVRLPIRPYEGTDKK